MPHSAVTASNSERLVNQQLKMRKELQTKIDALGRRSDKRAEILQQGPTLRVRGRDVPTVGRRKRWTRVQANEL